MRSFLKIKSSRNGEIILAFTYEVNHVMFPNFYIENMSLMLFAKLKFSLKFSNLKYSISINIRTKLARFTSKNSGFSHCSYVD